MFHPDIDSPPPRPNTHPQIDSTEVRACRLALTGARVIRRHLYPTARGADPDWLSEAEVYGYADEAALARDLELWGERPFDLED